MYQGFVIEDLKTFTDAVEMLDDLYDRALAEGKGKLMPLLMNRSKAQLLFCMQVSLRPVLAYLLLFIL